MGKTWCVIGLIVALFLVFGEAKPATNPVIVPANQNPEDLRRLYAALQHQMDDENELRNMIDSPQRVQLGTLKTRRAPSMEGFEWEGMISSMDNLRKPRFG